MARFSWVYLGSVTDQKHQIPLDWSPSHLMSTPSLRTHPQPTFNHGRDRFVLGFDTGAATGVGLKSTLQTKSRFIQTQQSLFKKTHTTTCLAWRRCCTSAVGLRKGMS